MSFWRLKKSSCKKCFVMGRVSKLAGQCGLVILVVILAGVDAGCPVADNPSQMFQCLSVNPEAFVDLISKGEFKNFCQMANGYMTCMTTYVRDCIGGKAATGIMEELQELNLKCCISSRTQDCILKSNHSWSIVTCWSE